MPCRNVIPIACGHRPTGNHGLGPLRFGAVVIERGVLELAQRDRLNDPQEHRLVEACMSQLAIALERVHFVEVAQSNLVQMEGGKMRNTLLGVAGTALRLNRQWHSLEEIVGSAPANLSYGASTAKAGGGSGAAAVLYYRIAGGLPAGGVVGQQIPGTKKPAQ